MKWPLPHPAIIILGVGACRLRRVPRAACASNLHQHPRTGAPRGRPMWRPCGTRRRIPWTRRSVTNRQTCQLYIKNVKYTYLGCFVEGMSESILFANRGCVVLRQGLTYAALRSPNERHLGEGMAWKGAPKSDAHFSICHSAGNSRHGKG